MSFTIAPHRYNAKPSMPDMRNYRMTLPPHYRLPESSYLAVVKPLPAIRDQGQEGSCTGFGITSAWEIEAAMYKPPGFIPSPAAEYYWEREIEHATTQDNGAQISDGLDVMRKIGLIPESTFPYLAGQFTLAPSAAMKATAAKTVIASYTQLTSLQEILYTLASKHVVIIGFSVYESFEQVGSDGLVPMPGAGEKMLGGHCTKLVGYNKRNGRLRMPNQWGLGWGNKGYAELPFGYAAFTANSPIWEAWKISL